MYLTQSQKFLLLLLVTGLTTSGCSDKSSDEPSAAPQSFAINNPDPLSTLLAPGTTEISFSVQTTIATSCRYAVNSSVAFNAMTPFDQSSDTLNHQTTIAQLNPNPATVNRVTVRCAENPEHQLDLIYRALPNVEPGYPRTSNLWGIYISEWTPQQTVDWLARYDLIVLGEAPPEAIQRWRELNPAILILTSTNATSCVGDECATFPNDHFLRDINGNTMEGWPGGFQLNLTKPEVAEELAERAYQKILENNLLYDGIFFDNVHLTQSWLTQDMHGNPFIIDTDGDGVQDNAATLDAAWRTGVLHEMDSFHELMPHAYVTGHALAIEEPIIRQVFNGMGFGFMTSEVIEGRNVWGSPYTSTFNSLWSLYQGWQEQSRSPQISSIESAVPNQIAYGYGYQPFNTVPAAVLEFAEDYYPYMRFGLAFTLMHDGYFAHEFGDTWHGNWWWYDELDFDLGVPLGPAESVNGNEALLQREYTNGLVVLNATRDRQTINVGTGFRRLQGNQAPMVEYIIDDGDPEFSSTGNWQLSTYDTGDWHPTPPYYHDWEEGLYEGTGQAVWQLNIPIDDTYTITTWCAAAPAAATWNNQATYEVVANGNVIATAIINQQVNEDGWHTLAENIYLTPADGAYIRLTCNNTACAADALHIRSTARYNDGSPATSVSLQAMDGIVLQRTQ